MPFDSNLQSVSQRPAEQELQTLKDQVSQLQSQIQSLQGQVSILEAGLRAALDRYVATCPGCQTTFDMLAHHYSIGLFDNLVYVKCPKCQKALPVKGGAGGNVKTVDD